MDLVQVSPNGSDPVVCKILDYGKYLFDKEKISSKLKHNLKKYHQLISVIFIKLKDKALLMMK